MQSSSLSETADLSVVVLLNTIRTPGKIACEQQSLWKLQVCMENTHIYTHAPQRSRQPHGWTRLAPSVKVLSHQSADLLHSAVKVMILQLWNGRSRAIWRHDKSSSKLMHVLCMFVGEKNLQITIISLTMLTLVQGPKIVARPQEELQLQGPLQIHHP